MGVLVRVEVFVQDCVRQVVQVIVVELAEIHAQVVELVAVVNAVVIVLVAVVLNVQDVRGIAR